MKRKTYVSKLAKQSKTNFAASFLFMPRKKRDAIHTVYCFCRHTDDIVDEIEDTETAKRTLDRWRAELDACYDGQPQHPITCALHEINQNFDLPKEYFSQLIDGCEMDLTIHRYATFADLERYCYHVASIVGLMCIEIFGYRSERTHDYAVALGMALQLTNIMRDVKEDAARDRIYLPQDELERFGYSETELLESRYNSSFIQLMTHQAERAQSFYDRAISLYEPKDHHLVFPAEIMHHVYYNLFTRIRQVKYDVFGERISVPKSTRLQIALSHALRATIRNALPWK